VSKSGLNSCLRGQTSLGGNRFLPSFHLSTFRLVDIADITEGAEVKAGKKPVAAKAGLASKATVQTGGVQKLMVRLSFWTPPV
jgi:hypothetical protein